MWVLLNKNLRESFETKYTYLVPINKNNFYLGKNNSGKSYFMRYILKNTVKIYNTKEEVIDSLKKYIDEKDFDIKNLKNSYYEDICGIYAKYQEKNDLYNAIIEGAQLNGTRTLGPSGYPHYKYTNINENKVGVLLNYLDINTDQEQLEEILNSKFMTKKDELRKHLSNKFKNELNEYIDKFEDDKIFELGQLFSDVEYFSINNISFNIIYIPIMRGLRNPIKSIRKKEIKEDIYKARVEEEFQFDTKKVKVISGLNFYTDYKKMLLGSKDLRNKISNFEKFVSQYFFDGQDISIIPDEETFEIKVNINDKEDKFIYEVGDGISSLLIILYTVFTISKNDEHSLFFIEEPENSFHPGFQRLLINVITYYKEFENCNFFFTTHSNHLVDIGVEEMQNSNVLVIKKVEHSIKVEYQDSEYNDILSELEVKNTSVRIANKVIWVEGKYDALYIRLLLNLKSKNSNEKKYIEDYDYCFLPYGGSNMKLIKFDKEEDNEKNSEFILKAERINKDFLIILDDDEMNPKTAKYKKYEILKSKLGDKIYKLEVREIENLFPKEVINMYIEQGLKEEYKIKQYETKYDKYKKVKIGRYINELLNKQYKNKTLKEITDRKDGFLKNGFLYDKQKFYNIVLEWSNKKNFDYEKDIPLECKNLINIVEKFIEN